MEEQSPRGLALEAHCPRMQSSSKQPVLTRAPSFVLSLAVHRVRCCRRVLVVVAAVELVRRAASASRRRLATPQVAGKPDHQDRSDAHKDAPEPQVERRALHEIQELDAALGVRRRADRDAARRAPAQQIAAPEQRLCRARTLVVRPVEDVAQVLELARDRAAVADRLEVHHLGQKRIAERTHALHVAKARQQRRRRVELRREHRDRLRDVDRVADVLALRRAVDRVELGLDRHLVVVRRVRLALPVVRLAPHQERRDRDRDEHQQQHDDRERIEQQPQAPPAERGDRAQRRERDHDAGHHLKRREDLVRRVHERAHDVHPARAAHLQRHVEHEDAARQQHAVDRQQHQRARPLRHAAHLSIRLSVSVCLFAGVEDAS